MQYNENAFCKYLYSSREIGPYLKESYNYKLAPFVSIKKFIENCGFIEEIHLENLSRSLPEKLYFDKNKIKAEITPLDIAINLKVDYFLTGYYVFAELGLTEYTPKVIHVDWVRKKDRNTKQTNINNDILQQIAFKPKKETSNILVYEGYQIMLLNGKYLGLNFDEYITTMKVNNINCAEVKTLKLEKLMIESLVNYQYFGGADLVWGILMKIKSIVDMNIFLEFFKKIGYQYPYQNAMGYILECANVDAKYINYFKDSVNKEIKFHLFLGDNERRVWNDKWNLYIPKRFS